MVIELSAKATVVNNIVARNVRDGILIGNSGQIDVWNNTVSANAKSISISQDNRLASDLSAAGHDPRQQLPDPTVTWVTANITVSNNVFADGTNKCVLCVEDFSHQRSGAQMNITVNGNVYQRTRADLPAWAFVWSRGVGNPAVYTTLDAFRAETGQDRNSVLVDGAPVLENLTTLAPDILFKELSIAQPLPASLADIAGQKAGTEHVGVWK